jgi:hypothetical protein
VRQAPAYPHHTSLDSPNRCTLRVISFDSILGHRAGRSFNTTLLLVFSCDVRIPSVSQCSPPGRPAGLVFPSFDHQSSLNSSSVGNLDPPAEESVYYLTARPPESPSLARQSQSSAHTSSLSRRQRALPSSTGSFELFARLSVRALSCCLRSHVAVCVFELFVRVRAHKSHLRVNFNFTDSRNRRIDT